jgi:hypothetical protein
MKRTVSDLSLRSLPAGFHPLDGKVRGRTLSCDRGTRRDGQAAVASARPPQRMPFSLRMRARSRR